MRTSKILFLCLLVPAGAGAMAAEPVAPTAPVAVDPAGVRAPAVELFVTADQCVACHNGLVAADGTDISIGSDWSASMMANAARDPYWQAGVRREVLDHPESRAAIENECSACHMPMMRFEAKTEGMQGGVFAHLPVGGGPGQVRSRDNLLADDGVSCTLCHQIQSEGFGEKESFTAGFEVERRELAGKRSVMGPYLITAGRQAIMRSASRYTPEQSIHMQESELCATCHTLFTHSLGEKGEVLGEFPEQVPYLEWLHSDFRQSQSCQACHMPPIEGEARISSVLGEPREGASPHSFRGGNFIMPRLLNRYRSELGVTASPQSLEATAAGAEENLQERAARLAIETAPLEGGRLEVAVTVANLAGHKLPSAYPSRRAWLHLRVLDQGGAVVFESGALGLDGAIAGNDNDADAARYEPHFEVIEASDQVQIWETILGNPAGEVTTGLLTADSYLKDNRLLPRGFDKATAEDAVAVHGSALEDEDFAAGGDRVVYAIDLEGVAEPLSVKAELLYQPIGYRWAQNLGQQPSFESERFLGYWAEMASSSAVRMAHAETAVLPSTD